MSNVATQILLPNEPDQRELLLKLLDNDAALRNVVMQMVHQVHQQGGQPVALSTWHDLASARTQISARSGNKIYHLWVSDMQLVKALTPANWTAAGSSMPSIASMLAMTAIPAAKTYVPPNNKPLTLPTTVSASGQMTIVPVEPPPSSNVWWSGWINNPASVKAKPIETKGINVMLDGEKIAEIVAGELEKFSLAALKANAWLEGTWQTDSTDVFKGADKAAQKLKEDFDALAIALGTMPKPVVSPEERERVAYERDVKQLMDARRERARLSRRIADIEDRIRTYEAKRGLRDDPAPKRRLITLTEE